MPSRRPSLTAPQIAAILNMDSPLMINALGALGTVLSNCLGFANLPAMLDVRTKGDLGDVNSLVFPFLCANGAAWCMYAVTKKVV